VADDGLEMTCEISTVAPSRMVETGTVEHEFTVFSKAGSLSYGLIVGWKLVQLAVEAGMVVYRLVRRCCWILIKLFAAKQDEMPGADWTMCDATSQVPSVY